MPPTVLYSLWKLHVEIVTVVFVVGAVAVPKELVFVQAGLPVKNVEDPAQLLVPEPPQLPLTQK